MHSQPRRVLQTESPGQRRCSRNQRCTVGTPSHSWSRSTGCRSLSRMGQERSTLIGSNTPWGKYFPSFRQSGSLSVHSANSNSRMSMRRLGRHFQHLCSRDPVDSSCTASGTTVLLRWKMSQPGTDMHLPTTCWLGSSVQRDRSSGWQHRARIRHTSS